MMRSLVLTALLFAGPAGASDLDNWHAATQQCEETNWKCLSRVEFDFAQTTFLRTECDPTINAASTAGCFASRIRYFCYPLFAAETMGLEEKKRWSEEVAAAIPKAFDPGAFASSEEYEGTLLTHANLLRAEACREMNDAACLQESRRALKSGETYFDVTSFPFDRCGESNGAITEARLRVVWEDD